MRVMRPHKVKLYALCVLLLGLTGCVSVPITELDQSASRNIKTIALLNVAEPKSEVVLNMGGGAALFGAIGGAIQGITNENHGNSYSEMVAGQNIQFSPETVGAIKNALSADGYNVVYLNDQKPALASDGKTDDFSAIHTDADAILVVWFTTVGYVSPPDMTSFEPWVVIRVRLLDAKSKQDLYFKTFSGGYDMKAKNSIYVPAATQYQYQSFDDLTSAFDQSVQGLKISIQDIAAYVGRDFSHGAMPVAITAQSQLAPVSAPNSSGETAASVANTAEAPVVSQPVSVTNTAPEPFAMVPAEAEQMPQQTTKQVPVSAPDDLSPGLTLKQNTQVHTRPVQQAPVATTLAAGSKVKRLSGSIINASGEWCFIQSGDISGWILASSIVH